MAHKRLPKTCYHSPKGRAENGAPLPLNKLLLGAKHRLPIERNALWHTTLRKQWLSNGNQFSLDGGIPAWTVEGDDLAKVNDFLKKSCMEFCGSLPGDDKGEDGYSLSGEARDAATSRNGLNENRKSVAEMIQECFDSIENNGDAI